MYNLKNRAIINAMWILEHLQKNRRLNVVTQNVIVKATESKNEEIIKWCNNTL